MAVTNSRTEAKAAGMLIGAKIKIDASKYGLSESSQECAAARQTVLQGEIDKIRTQARPLLDSITQRLSIVHSDELPEPLR